MLLPQKIKSYLERSRLYLRLRYSRRMYAVWLLFRADVRKETILKKKLYNSVLPQNCNLVFDIGANEGVLTSIFSSRAQIVIAVEPSQRNIEILSARFNNQKNVVVVPKAVSNVCGYQYWYEDKIDYATGTLNSKWNDAKPDSKSASNQVETVTLDDLIHEFGMPDFTKIDIEGHEQQAFESLSSCLPSISFEAILPKFLDETILCIRRLLIINSSYTFNYSVDNVLVYKTYQAPDVILSDIQNIQQTIDIFCKR